MKLNINEKRVILYFIIGIIFILSIVILLFFNNFINNNKMILKDEKNINLFNTNAITMLYETEVDSGEYQVASDNSWPQDGYTFNDTLSKCENGSKLTWDNENKKIVMQANVSDKCYVYFDKEPDIVYLADYIMNTVYQGDGVNGLYYHDGQGSYTNADQEAGDNSYRYSGANPNNYVCFGSDTETCPEDNLYRIIGVFNNQVKLIKSTIYGENYLTGYWNTDLKDVFNTTYYNTFDTIWQNKIAIHSWNVGGLYINNNSKTAKQYYDIEIVGSSSIITDNVKIGLMYISDYGFAASSENWITPVSNYSSTTINWLYLEYTEYYMSDISVAPMGGTGSGSDQEKPPVMPAFSVRPSFYLEPDAVYVSGSGSKTDPMRIT